MSTVIINAKTKIPRKLKKKMKKDLQESLDWAFSLSESELDAFLLNK